MIASTYAEITVAIDRAFAGPEDRPLRWRNIAASIADSLVRGVHPLKEMAEMGKEFQAAPSAPIVASPEKDFIPGVD